MIPTQADLLNYYQDEDTRHRDALKEILKEIPRKAKLPLVVKIRDIALAALTNKGSV